MAAGLRLTSLTTVSLVLHCLGLTRTLFSLCFLHLEWRHEEEKGYILMKKTDGLKLAHRDV